MAYFLEYTAGQAAGRSHIQCVAFVDALTKAKDALRGLRCTSAVLRHASGSSPAFGEGFVLAAYTPDEGWQIHDAGLGASMSGEGQKELFQAGEERHP